MISPDDHRPETDPQEEQADNSSSNSNAEKGKDKGPDTTSEQHGSTSEGRNKGNSSNPNVNEVKGNAEFNTTQTIYEQNYNYYGGAEEGVNGELNGNANTLNVRFGKNEVNVLDENEANHLYHIKDFITDEPTLTEGVQKLEKYGVLVITGNGKASLKKIGQLLGIKIQTRRLTEQVMVSDAPEQRLLVNFRTDIAQSKDFEKSTLVLNDPVGKRNQRFSQALDQFCGKDYGLETQLMKELRANHVYVIFVFDEELMGEHEALSLAPYHVRVFQPTTEQRERYLVQQIKALIEQKYWDPQQTESLQLVQTTYAADIASNLGYISDIDRLVNDLEQLLKRGTIDLKDPESIEVLISNIQNLESWLIQDLGQDLEAWSFILALTLLSTTSEGISHGVGIIAFELFRRQIASHLQEHVNLKIQPKTWPGVTAESTLINRCRAQKIVDGNTNKTQIAFLDEDYPGKVWGALIKEMSFHLINLIPFFQKLIEENNYSHNVARVLGRIGEIDLPITQNWILSWSNRDEERMRALVGHLFQGIHASKNQEYIGQCESFLEHLSREGSYKQVWTAVSAFKQIGLYRTPYALAQMKAIAERHLAKPYEEVRKLRAQLSWDVNKLGVFSNITLKELMRMFDDSAQINKKAVELKQHEELFQAIAYSLSALCFMLDPISVFAEWKKWLSSENRAVRVFVVKILLLGNIGVLRQLDRGIRVSDRQKGTTESWHYMALVLAFEENAHEVILNFFAEVVSAFKDLETGESRVMEKSMVNNVSQWAVYSLEVAVARKEVASFIGAMMHRIPSLEKPFQAKLKQWSNHKALRYRTLATEVEGALHDHKAAAKTKTKISFEDLGL